jgi:hypothetical protein
MGLVGCLLWRAWIAYNSQVVLDQAKCMQEVIDWLTA